MANKDTGKVFFPIAISSRDNTSAHELGDFEAGTWTPRLSFVTPGDLAVSYSSQSGRYVKIGGFAIFNCVIAITSFAYTTANSYLIVTGFPSPMNEQSVGAGSMLMNCWSKTGTTQKILRRAIPPSCMSIAAAA